MKALAIAILLAGLTTVPLAAQESAEEATTEDAAAEDATAEDADTEDGATDEAVIFQAAYDESLNRLGEISGALFHLDALCRPGRQDIWRRHVEDFLAAQRLGEERSGRLIARFNAGYRDYAATHAACTPAARELSRRFAQEGVTITSDLAARYGD